MCSQEAARLAALREEALRKVQSLNEEEKRQALAVAKEITAKAAAARQEADRFALT